MARDIELWVTEGRDAQLLRFLSDVLALESRCELHIGEVPRTKVKTPSMELTGLSTVCRHLVVLSSTISPAELLGSYPEEAAQISEWINSFLDPIPSSGDAKLKKVAYFFAHGLIMGHAQLNEHLSGRVYLISDQLTLADLIVYVAIHADAVHLPAAQYGHFCNLIRWHAFIQESIDVHSILHPVKRKLPVFDFSPPAKAASKKKTEAKSANGSTGVVDKDPQKQSEESKTKKEKKPKEGKKEPRIDMVDMRIGKILSIKHHPDAESLYIEEIDVGEEKPRQVISGLVKFVPIEEMQGRIVIVCCNLKPANMRGIPSNGMVMCASNAEHTKVIPLQPPKGVEIGERIQFEGYTEDPEEEIKPKQKILEALFPDLITDGEGLAKYKAVPFTTSKGPIRSTLTNGNIR